MSDPEKGGCDLVTSTALKQSLSSYVTTAAFDAYNAPLLVDATISTDAGGVCTITELDVSDPGQAVGASCFQGSVTVACPSDYAVTQLLCSLPQNPVLSQSAFLNQARCDYAPFSGPRVETLLVSCSRVGPLSPGAARIAAKFTAASAARTAAALKP